MRMKRVFVTGAGGWVGGQVMRALDAREDIEAFGVDDILDGFFGQIMINSEDLMFPKIPAKALIQIDGCF